MERDVSGSVFPSKRSDAQEPDLFTKSGPTVTEYRPRIDHWDMLPFELRHAQTGAGWKRRTPVTHSLRCQRASDGLARLSARGRSCPLTDKTAQACRVTHRLLGLAFLRLAVGAVLGLGWFSRRSVLVAAAADVLKKSRSRGERQWAPRRRVKLQHANRNPDRGEGWCCLFLASQDHQIFSSYYYRIIKIILTGEINALPLISPYMWSSLSYDVSSSLQVSAIVHTTADLWSVNGKQTFILLLFFSFVISL